MPLPEYLQDNKKRILEIPPQQSFVIEKYLNEKYINECPDVLELLITHLGKENNKYIIDRQKVIALYALPDKRVFVLGIMIWGGISLVRKHYVDVLLQLKNVNIDEFNARIVHTMKLLKENKYSELFTLYKSGGRYHLKSVGLSFFTKLFFFIGEAENILPRPLILDILSIACKSS